MLTIIAVAVLLLASLGAAHPAWRRWNARQTASTKFLFVLGDSYSNLAFNPDSTQPSPGNTFGNTDMATQIPDDANLTLGPNWVSDLSTVYNATEMLTYDLAFDCAVVNGSLITDDCPWALPYNISWQTDVVAQTVAKGSPYGQFVDGNVLFAYFIGINDASIPVKNYRLGFEDIVHADVADLFVQMERVYSLGFRDFLVLTVPPYDRTPQVQAPMNATYVQAQQHAISVWNADLKAAYEAWTSGHADVNSAVFDTTDVFNYVLDHPVEFGANQTGENCYGTLPDCLWADDFHPGPALHKQLAKELAQSSSAKLAGWFKGDGDASYAQRVMNEW